MRKKYISNKNKKMNRNMTHIFITIVLSSYLNMPNENRLNVTTKNLYLFHVLFRVVLATATPNNAHPGNIIGHKIQTQTVNTQTCTKTPIICEQVFLFFIA